MSCETRNQYEIEFEDQLSKTDLSVLRKLVLSYEKLISTEFNGDASKFIALIASDKPTFKGTNKRKYCELLRKLHESTLESKSLNIKYDSVYLTDKNTITTIKQPEDISEDVLQLNEEIVIFPPGRTIEDELKEIKERGYWRFISASSFTMALSKISHTSVSVQSYLESNNAAGDLDPQRMASSIIENKVDLKNSFVKRIIVMELFIKQIRKEYGC